MLEGLGLIATLVKLALGFADKLMGYLDRGQLLEAGKQMRDSENFKRAEQEIQRAEEAAQRMRDLIASNPDGLQGVSDPFRAD